MFKPRQVGLGDLPVAHHLRGGNHLDERELAELCDVGREQTPTITLNPNPQAQTHIFFGGLSNGESISKASEEAIPVSEMIESKFALHLLSGAS